jgi:hypothetical protein
MHDYDTKGLETPEGSHESSTELNGGITSVLLAHLREALRSYLQDRPDGGTLRTVREDGDAVAVVYELGTTKCIESDEDAREALDTLRAAGYGGEV